MARNDLGQGLVNLVTWLVFWGLFLILFLLAAVAGLIGTVVYLLWR